MGQENLSLLLVTRFGILYGFLSSLPVHPSQIIAMRAYLIHGNLLGIVSLAGYFCGQALMLLLPHTTWGGALLGFRFVQSNLFRLTVSLGALVASSRLARESLVAPRLSQTSTVYDPRRLGPGVSSLQDPRAKLYFVLSLLSYLVVPHTPFSVLPRLTNVWSFRHSHQPLFVAGNLLGLLLGHAAFHQVSNFSRAIIEHQARRTYTMLLGRINLSLNLLLGLLIGCQVDRLDVLDPGSLERSVVDLPKRAALWLEDETSRWFPSRNKSKLSIYGRIVQLEAEKQATEELLLKAMVEEKAHLQRQGRMLLWGERPEEQLSGEGLTTARLERVVADQLRTLRPSDKAYKPKRHDRIALTLLTQRERGKPTQYLRAANDKFRDTVRQRLSVLPSQADLLAYCEDVLRYATRIRRASVGWPEPRFYATTQQASPKPRIRLSVSRPLQEDQREYTLQSQLRRLHLLLFRGAAGRASLRTHSSGAARDLRIKPSELAYLLQTGDCESKLSMQAWARLIGRSMISNPWGGLVSSAGKRLRLRAAGSGMPLLHPSAWESSREGHGYIPGQFQFLVTSKWLESLDARSLRPFRAVNLRAQERAKQVLASIELDRIRSLSQADVKVETNPNSGNSFRSQLKSALHNSTPELLAGHPPVFDPAPQQVARGLSLPLNELNTTESSHQYTSAALGQPRFNQLVQSAKHRLRDRERAGLSANLETQGVTPTHTGPRFRGKMYQRIRDGGQDTRSPLHMDHAYVPHLYLMKRSLRRLRLAFVDSMSWWSHRQRREEDMLHRLNPELKLLPSAPSDQLRSQTLLRWIQGALDQSYNYTDGFKPSEASSTDETTRTRIRTGPVDLGSEVQAGLIEAGAQPDALTSFDTEIKAAFKRLSSTSTQGALSTEQHVLLPVLRLRKRLSGSLTARSSALRAPYAAVPRHYIWDFRSKDASQAGHNTGLIQGVLAKRSHQTQKQPISGNRTNNLGPQKKKSLLSLFKQHADLDRIKLGIRYLRMVARFRFEMEFGSLDTSRYALDRSAQTSAPIAQGRSQTREQHSLNTLKGNWLLRPFVSLIFDTSGWMVARVSGGWRWIQDVLNVLLTPVGSRTGRAEYTVCFLFFGKPHRIYQPSGRYMSRQVQGWMDALWFQDATQIRGWRKQITDPQDVSWMDVSPLLGDKERSLYLADRMVAIRIDSLGDWVRLMSQAFLRNPVAALLDAQLQFIPLGRERHELLFGSRHGNLLTPGLPLTEPADGVEQPLSQADQGQASAVTGHLLRREREASLKDENSPMELQAHYQRLCEIRHRVTNRLWLGLGLPSPPYLAESVIRAFGISTRIPVPLFVKSFPSSRLGYEPQRWWATFDTGYPLWPKGVSVEVLFQTTGAAPNLPWWVGVDLAGFGGRVVRSGAHQSHRSYSNPHRVPKAAQMATVLSGSRVGLLPADEEDAKRLIKRVPELLQTVGPRIENGELLSRAQSLQSIELQDKQLAWAQRVETAAEGLPVYKNPIQFALPDLYLNPLANTSLSSYRAQPARGSKQAAGLARQRRYNRLWSDLAGAHASFAHLRPATDWKRAIQSLSGIQLTLGTEQQLKQVTKSWEAGRAPSTAIQPKSHSTGALCAPSLPRDKRHIAGIVRGVTSLRPNQFWQGGLPPREGTTRLRVMSRQHKQRAMRKYSRACVKLFTDVSSPPSDLRLRASTNPNPKRQDYPFDLAPRPLDAQWQDPNRGRQQWRQKAEELSKQLLRSVRARRKAKMPVITPTRHTPQPPPSYLAIQARSQELLRGSQKDLWLKRVVFRHARLSAVQAVVKQEIRSWIHRLNETESRALRPVFKGPAFRDESLEQAQFQPRRPIVLRPSRSTSYFSYEVVGFGVRRTRPTVRRSYAGRKRRALGLAQREWIYTGRASQALLWKVGNRLPRVARLNPFASQDLDRVALRGSKEALRLQEELSITNTDAYMRPQGSLRPLLRAQLDYPFDGLPESFVERNMYALRPWHYTKSLWRVKDSYPRAASSSALAQVRKPITSWIRRIGLDVVWAGLVHLWQSMLRTLFRANT
uniref:hypothetical chloroplast RF1 n=1 Tax=Hormidiella parvula TaxID=2058785 RepID=UPI00286A66DB|nr:hypothetical chloroplast RF1 [Hormidiella parvula]WKT05944.1 hypothetical chloroplast RF1 [Hormidiella parvula]